MASPTSLPELQPGCGNAPARHRRGWPRDEVSGDVLGRSFRARLARARAGYARNLINPPPKSSTGRSATRGSLDTTKRTGSPNSHPRAAGRRRGQCAAPPRSRPADPRPARFHPSIQRARCSLGEGCVSPHTYGGPVLTSTHVALPAGAHAAKRTERRLLAKECDRQRQEEKLARGRLSFLPSSEGGQTPAIARRSAAPSSNSVTRSSGGGGCLHEFHRNSIVVPA
jgi:hypothetical protein